MVGFEEEIGRRDFTGPEFLDNGILLKLVAEGNQLVVIFFEALGKLRGILGRNGLVLKREAPAGAELHHMGCEKMPQVLVREQRVN